MAEINKKGYSLHTGVDCTWENNEAIEVVYSKFVIVDIVCPRYLYFFAGRYVRNH